MKFTYDAIVRNVHDGDTITVDLDLGMDTWIKNRKLRLHGINAPELNTADGKDSREYLSILLPVGAAVTVRTVQDKTEKYGRYLAIVSVNAIVVNDALIRTGHAVPWDGKGPRP